MDAVSLSFCGMALELLGTWKRGAGWWWPLGANERRTAWANCGEGKARSRLRSPCAAQTMRKPARTSPPCEFVWPPGLLPKDHATAAWQGLSEGGPRSPTFWA